MGDFNVNLHVKSSVVSDFEEIMFSTGFMPVISTHTHMRSLAVDKHVSTTYLRMKLIIQLLQEPYLIKYPITYLCSIFLMAFLYKPLIVMKDIPSTTISVTQTSINLYTL